MHIRKKQIQEIEPVVSAAIEKENVMMIRPDSLKCIHSDHIRGVTASILMCPREHNPTLYDQLLAMCEAAGFRHRLITAPSDAQLILSFIAEGVGLAVGPQSLAELSRRGVITRETASDPYPLAPRSSGRLL